MATRDPLGGTELLSNVDGRPPALKPEQTNVTQDARVALTSHAIAAKAIKDLSFAQLAEGTGHRVTYAHRGVAGPARAAEAAAELVADRLGLDAADSKRLQAVPLRGSILGGVPTDRTVYRFYEMVQIYGTTLKSLVHEQFGDDIISAINFKLDIQKVADPDGGKRAVITSDGKFRTSCTKSSVPAVDASRLRGDTVRLATPIGLLGRFPVEIKTLGDVSLLHV